MSGLIYKKMSEVMASIGTVSKDQKNAQQGFKFRGIDQFINALYPALTKAGVFMTPRVVSVANEVKEVERSSGKKGYDRTVNLLVEYDFYAEDGSKVTVGPIASEGLDSGDKATNKALSAALKYALIQTFSIPTEDMVDGDSVSPELGVKIPTAQRISDVITELPIHLNGGSTVEKKRVSFAKKTIPSPSPTTGDDI